eukprot:scaffold12678_cov116-Cylindrotheca_fusiformis.AAC.3
MSAFRLSSPQPKTERHTNQPQQPNTHLIAAPETVDASVLCPPRTSYSNNVPVQCAPPASIFVSKPGMKGRNQ